MSHEPKHPYTYQPREARPPRDCFRDAGRQRPTITGVIVRLTQDAPEDLLDSVSGVLSDVLAERVRQDVKWGQQNHPDGTGLPSDAYNASLAKGECDYAARNGTLTWRLILAEEVAEAFAETDPDRLETELTQATAVLTAWVEAIRRRRAR